MHFSQLKHMKNLVQTAADGGRWEREMTTYCELDQISPGQKLGFTYVRSPQQGSEPVAEDQAWDADRHSGPTEAAR